MGIQRIKTWQRCEATDTLQLWAGKHLNDHSSESSLRIQDFDHNRLGNLHQSVITTASPTFSGLTISGAGTITVGGLTASKPVFTDGSKNLTSSGTLALDQGGTGMATFGTANQMLGVNGTTSGLEYKTLTAGAGITITHTVQDVAISTNAPIDVRSYASFSAAITAIGATQATLLISTAQSVAVNVTVPENVTLYFLHGGSLSVANTITVTINGHVVAGPHKIFTLTGTGIVNFGAGSVEFLRPEWWGAIADDSTDCYAGLQAALTAADVMGGCVVRLQAGTYLKSAPLTIYDYTHLCGVGYNTVIENTDNNENGINVEAGGKRITIKDLRIIGTATFSTNSGIYIDTTSGANSLIADNVGMRNFQYGLYAENLFWNNVFRNVRVTGTDISFYIASASGNAINNIFEKCYSDAAITGGFRLGGTSATTVRGCDVGGSATSNYLIYVLTGSSLSIQDCNLEGATLGDGEAAIDIISTCTVSINNCKFTSITGPGGASYASYIQCKETSEVSITACKESGASGNLYAVQAYHTAQVSMWSNKFTQTLKHASDSTATTRIYAFDSPRIARTAIPIDLSGAATTLICMHSENACRISKATLLYTEASSADAGVVVEIGKESDRDYYYTGTTETSKSQWYSSDVTLLKTDFTAGDTVTFYSPGGKVGDGEIMLCVEYYPEA